MAESEAKFKLGEVVTVIGATPGKGEIVQLAYLPDDGGWRYFVNYRADGFEASPVKHWYPENTLSLVAA